MLYTSVAYPNGESERIPNHNANILSTPKDSSGKDSKILFSVADKVERLLHESSQRSKEHLTSNEQGSEASKEDEITNLLKVSNALLIATRSNHLLKDAILSNLGHVQVICIHQAFLRITTQCVNCIDSIEEDDPLRSNRIKSLLNQILKLSRTAHYLMLPFHLPLYERLIDAFASEYDVSPSPRTSRTILEIFSWIAFSTHNITMVSKLFRSVIEIILRRKGFRQAAYIILGMQKRFGVDTMDFESTSFILLQLRDAVKDQLESHPGTGRRKIPDKAMSDIVSMLEKSILNLTADERQNLELLALAFHNDDVAQVLSKLYYANVNHVPLSILENDSDDEIEDYGSDYHKNGDDGDNYTKKALTNPLDEAVHAMIISHVQNRTARDVISALLKSSTQTLELSLVPSTINVIMGAVHDDVTSTTKSTVLDWSDSDVNEFEDYYDARGQYYIPDVLDQFEKLNGGKKLGFTDLYQNILWSREYDHESDDEEEYYNSFFDSELHDHSDYTPDDDDDF